MSEEIRVQGPSALVMFHGSESVDLRVKRKKAVSQNTLAPAQNSFQTHEPINLEPIKKTIDALRN